MDTFIVVSFLETVKSFQANNLYFGYFYCFQFGILYYNVGVDIYMSFGRILRDLRENKNLTQEELGAKLNLKKAVISKYENDKLQPSIETINILADLFGVTVDYMFGRTKFKEIDMLDILEDDSTKLKIGDTLLSPQQRLGIARVLDNPDLIESTKNEQLPKDLEKTITDSNVMLDGMQLDMEDKKDVITFLKIIKKYKQKGWSNSQKVEILDLLGKPGVLITVGGRTLSINERIEILELIKEKIIEDTGQAPSDHEMIIAASHQGDSVIQSLSEEDKGDILNAIEFAKKQHKRKK